MCLNHNWYIFVNQKVNGKETLHYEAGGENSSGNSKQPLKTGSKHVVVSIIECL